MIRYSCGKASFSAKIEISNRNWSRSHDFRLASTLLWSATVGKLSIIAIEKMSREFSFLLGNPLISAAVEVELTSRETEDRL